MSGNKAELRKKFSKIRNEITFLYEKNCQIKQKVLKLLQGKERFSLFSYVSMKNEVDTRAIIADMFDAADVFVPHVRGECMTAVRLDCIERLSAVDRLGNVFSDGETPEIACKTPDVTLVPMLAFDDNLFRLGYGGGFYDRFLSGSNTLKVGLAFDEQQTDENFVEKFDVPLDVIITPTRVIRRKYGCSKKKLCPAKAWR